MCIVWTLKSGSNQNVILHRLCGPSSPWIMVSGLIGELLKRRRRRRRHLGIQVDILAKEL